MITRRDDKGLPLPWAVAVLAVHEPLNRLGTCLIVSEVAAGGLVAWVGIGRGRELAANVRAAHTTVAAALTAGGLATLIACLVITFVAATLLTPRVMRGALRRRQAVR
jgi:hypothetical protein